MGAVGAAACIGLTSTKPAPCWAADQTARSVRSVKSPTPQEFSERTLYSWAARPQARPPPSRAGTSSLAGVTMTGVLMSVEPICMCRWW